MIQDLAINRSIYLPFEDAHTAWDVSVTAAGHGCVEPGGNYPLGGHPSDHDLLWERGRVIDALQVVYIQQGQGEFENASNERHPIVSGTIFFLFPGVWHRYRPTREIGWIEDWVELRGPMVKRLIARRVIDTRQPVIQIGDQEPLCELFRQCLDLIDHKPAGFEALSATIGLQIVALVRSLALQRQTADDGHVLSAISRGQNLIAKRVELPLRTGQLARELGVSETYFRRAFKLQTGLTPKRYHVLLRLRKAQELLAVSSLTAKEIAARLGFDSPFHFSTHFKAKTGLSPTAWRNHNHSREKIRHTQNDTGDHESLNP